jgi:hypothetical protein
MMRAATALARLRPSSRSSVIFQPLLAKFDACTLSLARLPRGRSRREGRLGCRWSRPMLHGARAADGVVT